MKSARSIVPAPKSATATPSSFSVSVSTASAEASEAQTSSSMRMSARCTHLDRFWTPVARGMHDVGLDLEPHRAHAQRVLDALLAIDHEAARQDVQHLAVGRDGHRTGDLRRALDVLAGHLTPRAADGDRAARVLALDMVAANGHDGRLDAVARQPLGRLARGANRVDRLVDVDDDALLEAADALTEPLPMTVTAPSRPNLADERHDLARARRRARRGLLLDPRLHSDLSRTAKADGLLRGERGTNVPQRSSSGAR